jgi:hypothetical protein
MTKNTNKSTSAKMIPIAVTTLVFLLAAVFPLRFYAAVRCGPALCVADATYHQNDYGAAWFQKAKRRDG